MDAAEIESALEELHSQGYSEPELEASQQFISGRDAYSKSQMERSRQLYEQSLTFWEQRGEMGDMVELSPPPPLLTQNNKPAYSSTWGYGGEGTRFYIEPSMKQRVVKQKITINGACKSYSVQTVPI